MNEEKGFWTFCQTIFDWLKQQGPALGIFIYDCMSAKIARADQEKRDAVYALQIEKNHEQVDSDKRSDADVVDSIANGSK